jgi:DNA-directed RNA polymerase specialized sigma24 family protein
MGRKNLDYSNYAFTEAVNEYIHNKRNREMLILFYVDDVTLDELCDRFCLSLSQVKRIVRNDGQTVFKHIPYK